MPVDARGLSAHVLVDGRAVPELSDPDTTPRDWAFLREAATNGQVSPEAAAACAQPLSALDRISAGRGAARARAVIARKVAIRLSARRV